MFFFSLLLNKKKREIPFGKFVSHKKWHLEDKCYVTEIVEFRDSVECTKYYNKLVAEYTCKSQTNSYDIDAWSVNSFSFTNYKTELYRFGNLIQLTKTLNKNS